MKITGTDVGGAKKINTRKKTDRLKEVLQKKANKSTG